MKSGLAMSPLHTPSPRPLHPLCPLCPLPMNNLPYLVYYHNLTTCSLTWFPGSENVRSVSFQNIQETDFLKAKEIRGITDTYE